MTVKQPARPILQTWPPWRRGAQASQGIHQLPFQQLTTSGRASLILALQSLELRAGTPVLVPTYHCPTMVAPLVFRQLVPLFYGIDAEGLPRLDDVLALGASDKDPPGALIVSHLFDRARSLAKVHTWCAARGVPLIEDCAHAPIGMAGERPAGHWGHVSIASITKFAPVSEMGLLASQGKLEPPKRLSRPTMRGQIKAVWDVLDRAAPFGQPPALAGLVRRISRIRQRQAASAPEDDQGSKATTNVFDAMALCDMQRVSQAPSWAARHMAHLAFSAENAAIRRDNHAVLLRSLENVAGVRAVFGACPADSAPYAVPLWVYDAERVYAALREHGQAVYRWDRTWPGVPMLQDDQAPLWRRHLLQCLCHQSLSSDDMQQLGQLIRQLVRS